MSANHAERLRSFARLTSAKFVDDAADEIDRLTEEVARLREFAREIIRDAWRGGGDGGSVQDAAEHHGLIVAVPYDPAKHGDPADAGASFNDGDGIFVFADWLNRPDHKE